MQKAGEMTRIYYMRAERQILELETDILAALEIYFKFNVVYENKIVPELADFFNFILSIVDFDVPTIRSANLIKALKC